MKVPYTFALNHTVEEIHDNLLNAKETGYLLQLYLPKIRATLGLKSNT